MTDLKTQEHCYCKRFTCPATCPASYLHGQYGHSATTEGRKTECLIQEPLDSGKVESYSFTPPLAAKPR